jgi:hypothetical protein
MSLPRTTALSLTRALACAAGVCAAFATVTVAPAQAEEAQSPRSAPAPIVATTSATAAATEPVESASPAVDAELAVCPGQTFSQPFAALQDTNYYTLVQGSSFDSPGEGWQLHNGAAIVGATRPDGSSGGALDLPSGAYAVSPPVCVTLQYPTARTWVEDVKGFGGVVVGVYYAGSRPIGGPVGLLTAPQGAGWQLSRPFEVRPQLTGAEEGAREVRFVFASLGRGVDYRLSGLYVDPRMS